MIVRLRDEIRIARKYHWCCFSSDRIEPGQRYHYVVEINDGIAEYKRSEFGDWAWERAWELAASLGDRHEDGMDEYDARAYLLDEYGTEGAVRAAYEAYKVQQVES